MVILGLAELDASRVCVSAHRRRACRVAAASRAAPCGAPTTGAEARTAGCRGGAVAAVTCRTSRAAAACLAATARGTTRSRRSSRATATTAIRQQVPAACPAQPMAQPAAPAAASSDVLLLQVPGPPSRGTRRTGAAPVRLTTRHDDIRG